MYGVQGNPDPVVAMDNLFQKNFLPNIPEIALLDVYVLEADFFDLQRSAVGLVL